MSVGHTIHTLRRLPVLLDAEKGPYYIRWNLLGSESLQNMRKRGAIRLFYANHSLIDVVKVVVLFAQVGNCPVKAKFIVSQTLAEPILVETDLYGKNGGKSNYEKRN